MKLWLLRPVNRDHMGADMAHGFVVRAATEAAARAMAANDSGDEGAVFWTDAKRSRCAPLLAQGAPGVVICDYVQGADTLL